MTGCAAPVTTAVSATARSMGSAGTPIILISPRRTSLIAKRTAFTDTAATHTTGFPFFAPGRFDGNALSADLGVPHDGNPVSYTHLRAHETRHDLVCRL